MNEENAKKLIAELSREEKLKLKKMLLEIFSEREEPRAAHGERATDGRPYGEVG